tara:strand:+ start:294 stop:551 length:258 start_codon:yes stop_codon:yes gene_type:complete
MTDKKTTPTTSEAELFLKALKPEQQQAMYNLYVAVSNARVTSFNAKDIGNTMSGSEKALFNLGVISGQNTIIRQFKETFKNGLVV